MRFKTLRLKQLPGDLTIMPEQPRFARVVYNKVIDAYELHRIAMPELLHEMATLEQIQVHWWASLDATGLSIGERIGNEYDLITVELTVV